MKGHISPIGSPAKICLHCAEFQMFILSLCQGEECEVLGPQPQIFGFNPDRTPFCTQVFFQADLYVFSGLLLALTGVSTLRYGLCGLANRNLDTVVCAETDVQSGGGNPTGGKPTSASWVLETHTTLPEDPGGQQPEKASLEEVTLSHL